LDKLKTSANSDVDVKAIEEKFRTAMDDDFNSPVLIAELFDVARIINSIHDGKIQINQADLAELKTLLHAFINDVLGLKNDIQATDDLEPVMDFILNIRTEAKANKDYATSDKIRIGLNEIGFEVKDGKDGSTWSKK
jgi:cysteinyl-tRNA synthetase